MNIWLKWLPDVTKPLHSYKLSITHASMLHFAFLANRLLRRLSMLANKTAQSVTYCLAISHHM